MLDPSEADAFAYSSDEIMYMGERIESMLADLMLTLLYVMHTQDR